ncbi:MAG: dihydroxyacetone kinase phosphoryl donor subunit DhaM [Chloroflexota bacterium]
MIGIVFVSHSAKLAEGVKDLASQMTRGGVKLAPAGGDAEGGIGTSVERIAGAIREVSGDDGVLVLMDLGSAVMSAQMAVENLAGEAGDVLLSDAPLVEGGVVAAVEASIGRSLHDVNEAALGARVMRKVEG